MRVIAIDGPAGAGKSTVAKALAHRLGFDYLDTGAMFRAVTFSVLRRQIDPDDVDEVAGVAVDVQMDVGEETVVVDGVDATVEIRGPEVTSAVSLIAANPAVRAELRERQRQWAREHGGGVIEGRDIGSVVFPDAELKLYLTAAPEVRARRRHEEARELDYESVRASIFDRDRIDSTREDSPLTPPDDAVIIDTTDRTVDEIVEDILGHLEAG